MRCVTLIFPFFSSRVPETVTFHSIALLALAVQGCMWWLSSPGGEEELIGWNVHRARVA